MFRVRCGPVFPLRTLESIPPGQSVFLEPFYSITSSQEPIRCLLLGSSIGEVFLGISHWSKTNYYISGNNVPDHITNPWRRIKGHSSGRFFRSSHFDSSAKRYYVKNRTPMGNVGSFVDPLFRFCDITRHII